MNKKTVKKIEITINLLAIAALLVFAFAIFDPHPTLAAPDPKTAYTQSGIAATSGGADSSTLYDSLKGLIYIVMAVGGFWVMACLVFAGMKLSGSQGNPQARTAGFVGLAMACLGLFIIIKAYDIASWVASFGSTPPPS